MGEARSRTWPDGPSSFVPTAGGPGRTPGRWDGRLRLLEHVRPPGLRGRIFDLLGPLAARLMGPHVNRTTVDSVRRAGFVVLEETNVFSDWVKPIVAR